MDTKNAIPLKIIPKFGAFQLWNNFFQIKNRHNRTRTTFAFETRGPPSKSYEVRRDSIFHFKTTPPRTIIRTSDDGPVYRFLFQKLRVGRFEKFKIDTTTGHQFGKGTNAWTLVVERVEINVRIAGIVVVVIVT